MVRPLILLLAVTACGGDDGTPSSDAAVNLPAVQKATCPSAPSMISATGPGDFVPVATALQVGGIVKFVVSYSHDVVPDTSVNTDPLIDVGPFEGTCLQFNQVGTFGFKCTVDNHTGTITVN